MKNFGCHGNELPIKEILYQSVFGDKYYMIGHKFTISVTMDVSPFAWCLARAVLNTIKIAQHTEMMVLITSAYGEGSDEFACTHDLTRTFAYRINKVYTFKKTPNNF